MPRFQTLFIVKEHLDRVKQQQFLDFTHCHPLTDHYNSIAIIFQSFKRHNCDSSSIPEPEIMALQESSNDRSYSMPALPQPGLSDSPETPQGHEVVGAEGHNNEGTAYASTRVIAEDQENTRYAAYGADSSTITWESQIIADDFDNETVVDHYLELERAFRANPALRDVSDGFDRITREFRDLVRDIHQEYCREYAAAMRARAETLPSDAAIQARVETALLASFGLLDDDDSPSWSIRWKVFLVVVCLVLNAVLQVIPPTTELHNMARQALDALEAVNCVMLGMAVGSVILAIFGFQI